MSNNNCDVSQMRERTCLRTEHTSIYIIWSCIRNKGGVRTIKIGLRTPALSSVSSDSVKEVSLLEFFIVCAVVSYVAYVSSVFVPQFS